MAEINIISKGVSYRVLYDDEFHELISKYKWNISNGYARAYTGIKNGKCSFVYMHRMIAGDSCIGRLIDHINHDTIDNRICNIRVCDKAQNSRNATPFGRSKYKGVYFQKRILNGLVSIPYIRADIMTENARVRLGYFETEELAAKAYDEAAKIYHKEFAFLNFPTQSATP